MITSGVLKNGVGATVLYNNDNNIFTEVDFDRITGSIQIIDIDQDGDLDIYLYERSLNLV